MGLPGGWGPIWRGLVVSAFIVAVLPIAPPFALGQPVGATLTVLGGTAAVLKAGGSPYSPAPSGMLLDVGDQVATLAGGHALVTFFEGSELELGSETTIIIRELSAQGSRTSIRIESVIGSTVHRVVSLTDPGSSYRIESGGAVAFVRGTEFGYHNEADGETTAAVRSGKVDFPVVGQELTAGLRRTKTSRDDVVTDSFDTSRSLFDVISEPARSGNPVGTNNPGLSTGSRERSQSQSTEPSEKNPPQELPPTPGKTFLTGPLKPGDTVLQVASTVGFSVGDFIVINPGGATQEIRRIVAIGSLVIDVGVSFFHNPGEVIAVTTPPTPTPTTTTVPTSTATPTAVPTPTRTPTPTLFAPVAIAPFIDQITGTQGETYFTNTVQVTYQSGRVVFSGNPPPTTPFGVDDGMKVTVTRPDGSTVSATRVFVVQCGDQILTLPPFDVTVLFQPGVNTVRVDLFDICGNFERTINGPIWISNVNP